MPFLNIFDNTDIDKLFAYYTGTGVTLQRLIELKLEFDKEVWTSEDGSYSVYKLISVPKNTSELIKLLSNSGNSSSHFAISILKDYKIYYFIENIDGILYVRGRISLQNNTLMKLTIFPLGHKFGDEYFRILADNRIVINLHDNPTDGALSAYRRLYHMSVTLKNKGGFSDNGYYTIFQPVQLTIRKLYPHIYP